MLLNDLKKAALCVAAGFAVTMFGGCDSQKSTGAPAGAGAQRAPQVSVTEIQPTELDMTTTLRLSMKPQWQALKPSFRELRPCCIRPV